MRLHYHGTNVPSGVTLACLTLAHAVGDREVTTIGGRADAEGPHPIQRALDVAGAFQCGFCQPGMVLSAGRKTAGPPFSRSSTESSSNRRIIVRTSFENAPG